MEEMYHSVSQQLDKERKRRTTAVHTLTIVENSNADLRQKLKAEEDKVKAEKEKDEAEQHGYDVGVAETEDALRAEVPAICRAYCAQT